MGNPKNQHTLECLVVDDAVIACVILEEAFEFSRERGSSPWVFGKGSL